jgi:hypothetical protein
MHPSGNDDRGSEELVREPRGHPWLWLVYLLLYAVAIPWYWPAGYRGPLILGLPLWMAVTLLTVLALAGWTGWVISRYWNTGGEEDSHGDQ